MTEIQKPTVAELAEEAFLKNERLRMLSMMNTPTDFEERKRAAIEYAEAKAAAFEAQRRLDASIG